MWTSLLTDASLYLLLQKFDADLAATVKAEGCSCGGVLHSAKYRRKPRGPKVPEGYDTRHSFCCARLGCRGRRTPPSLRFLGRKVYLGVVVLLVTAMRHGVTDRRATELRRAVGASRTTLARWRRWWREAFPATDFWRHARALLARAISTRDLPASLIEVFVAVDDVMRVAGVLDFIKPVTTGASGPWRSSILMVD